MSGKSILVVEDDNSLGEVLCEALQSEGYVCAHAHNGAGALELLRSGAPLPDVIVMDLMMPVMDGWQLRDELKRDAALARIPIVALTAVSEIRPRIEVERVLKKPFDLRVLLDVLAQLRA